MFFCQLFKDSSISLVFCFIVTSITFIDLSSNGFCYFSVFHCLYDVKIWLCWAEFLWCLQDGATFRWYDFSISYGVRNLKSLIWIQPISFPYEKEVIVSISVLKCEFLVDNSELDRILIHTLNFASKFFWLVCIVSVEYLYHVISKYAEFGSRFLLLVDFKVFLLVWK